jgi:PleD family two-component response regulator
MIQKHQLSFTRQPTVSLEVATTVQQDAPLVLVVDDERAMRMLLRMAIAKEGYRAIEADSGEQGIEICQNLQPDLVLLDAVMPGMDGFTCCTHLRSLWAATTPTNLKKALPILMIATLDDPESIARAFEVGVTDYMTKPVNWTILSQHLHRLLSSSNS